MGVQSETLNRWIDGTTEPRKTKLLENQELSGNACSAFVAAQRAPSPGIFLRKIFKIRCPQTVSDPGAGSDARGDGTNMDR